MTSRGVGGLDRIAPLVHPGVDPKPVPATGPPHELPHPDGVGAAYRLVRVAALDQGQISQVSREALGLEAAADHGLVPGATLEEGLHPRAGHPFEVSQIILDPRV